MNREEGNVTHVRRGGERRRCRRGRARRRSSARSARLGARQLNADREERGGGLGRAWGLDAAREAWDGHVGVHSAEKRGM